MKNICIFIFMLLLPPLSLASELGDRDNIDKKVQEHIHNNSFSELESIASTYRTKEERTSSGLWKITLFYASIEDSYSYQKKDKKNWEDLIRKADQWIKAYPKSPTPYIAKAIALKSEAWTIRGTGYANTVATDAWKPFHEKIELSRATLEKSKLISNNDPHWYATMADIATIQSWEETDFKKLFDEGYVKYPNYYQMYFNAMIYYTPKWKGNANKVELFASEILEKTKSKEGFALYARIYWAASQTQFQGKLFENSKVRWNIMSKGIDDVLKKYPDQWNINSFALFSCLAQDKEKAKKLISMIEYPPISSAWLGSIENYAYCKTWIEQ